MTELFLDKNKLDYDDTDSDSTIGDLIGVLNAELTDLNRIIVELAIDGESIEDMHSPEILKKAMSDHGEIRITTSMIGDLLAGFIEHLLEYADFIKGESLSVAETVRAANVEDTSTKMSVLFDAITDFIRTLDSVHSAVRRFNLDIFSVSPDTSYEDLVKHLDELLTANKAGDMILVGDLLEYEIQPIIIGLEEILQNVELK